MLTSRIELPPYGSREEIPPNDCKEYYLFLLEFFVKQASGNRLARLNQMFYVPTSVRFDFLDFINENDLEVNPVDFLFQPQAGIAKDVEIFNTGKSVLFAVAYDAVTDRTVKMILKITVSKRMPKGIKSDILVGTGELDLSPQYAALRIETLQCWRKDVAMSKVFDGQVPLIHDKDTTGILDVYVRISSFGQTIVTELDAPISQESKTFVFGAEDIDQSYKCRKVDSRDVDSLKVSSEEFQDSATCPMCMPEKYPCIPCGKMGAVEERDSRMRCKRDDKMAKGKLKHMPSKSIIQASRDPPQYCGKSVILKVSGLFDNGDGIGRKKPTVTVADESAARKPDSSDPDYDIFVLRIGKKGLVGIGEKSDIQLEMKTPKGPERRPPIRYETREMQTEIEEEPPDKKKDKKKKRRK